MPATHNNFGKIKIVNSLKVNNSIATPPVMHENNLLTMDTEKAEVLNHFFWKCFNRSDSSSIHFSAEETCVSSEDSSILEVTEEEVVQLISSLPLHKSPGIATEMLKISAADIAPSLTMLFNHFIAEGKLPCEWKIACISPIPIGKDPKSPLDYRPISLLSVVSKMLERHVLNLLRVIIDEISPILLHQWGFCCRKSTSAALVSAVHFWNTKLHDGSDILCSMFFDLKKAFDSVPHRHLLDKLAKFHLPAPLLNWLAEYLSNKLKLLIQSLDCYQFCLEFHKDLFLVCICSFIN